MVNKIKSLTKMNILSKKEKHENFYPSLKIFEKINKPHSI